MEITIGTTLIQLKKGDITKEQTDAIVNAANSSLMGGGGVDGAIHRAGGPIILEECRKIVACQGGLSTGEAVITSGGNLPARYVIHTVGPVWQDGKHNEPFLLRNAYLNSLRLGAEHQLKSITFPSISTGVYGYPKEQAAGIAVKTIFEFLKNEPHHYKSLNFITFNDIDYNIYIPLLKI